MCLVRVYKYRSLFILGSRQERVQYFCRQRPDDLPGLPGMTPLRRCSPLAGYQVVPLLLRRGPGPYLPLYQGKRGGLKHLPDLVGLGSEGDGHPGVGPLPDLHPACANLSQVGLERGGFLLNL